MNAVSGESGSMADQYLTFTLGEEQYALEISRVREIVDCTAITRVPRMPASHRGVINLRGNVVPVFDLKLCLGMSAIEQTTDTCIVIAEIESDGELILAGMLADSVQEVLDIEASEIRPPVHIGGCLDNGFLRGMARRETGFTMLLDIDKVLSADEWSSAESEVAAAGGRQHHGSEEVGI